MTTPLERVRNFCIIAHIDHGKSTLADRMLELTGTVEGRKMRAQMLDQMDLERERGITIKLQPVSMRYVSQGDNDAYLFNLIDTPGHVDFHYEVSRSLAAVEGAILLVDATKGVQAQTVANLAMALAQDLAIIPAINKIDLPNADVARTKREIIHLLGCRDDEILLISAKTGEGVPRVLDAVARCIPAPTTNKDGNAPLRALIFDSIYDAYKGVVAYVRIVDGAISRDDAMLLCATQQQSSVVEVGRFVPHLEPLPRLTTGMIGYIATGLKRIGDCRVGDTITRASCPTRDPLPGYQKSESMVYASIYPSDDGDYDMLRDGLDKLTLNDAALTYEVESNPALGRGFRCGFLGLLHMDIVRERLVREFGITPVVTAPSVAYSVILRESSEEVRITAAADLPDMAHVAAIKEPHVRLEIMTTTATMGAVMNLVAQTRARYQTTDYIDNDRVTLVFHAPLADVIVDFHDRLKSVSSGYASMHYDPMGMEEADVVRLDILVAGDVVESLARIVPRESAYAEGKRIVEALKDVLPRQNFAVALQAAIGGKVIARETISALRKDVTAKLYGGDVTRKRKLLEKQKKGKKRMRQEGRVAIPPEAFMAILKR